jgi:hypothetical protein
VYIRAPKDDILKPSQASCPVPKDLTGYTVVQNIRSLVLRFGNIKVFKAYLSVATQVMSDTLSGAPLQIRSQIQSSGVSVTDVPGGKDVADKMLIGESSPRLIRPEDLNWYLSGHVRLCFR